MKKINRTALILCAAGALPVVWFAVLFALCNDGTGLWSLMDKPPRIVHHSGQQGRLPRDLSAEDSFFEHFQFIPLYEAINTLPDIQRRRLMAHYFMGLSPREIAVCEGVSIMAISHSLAKARKNLRIILGNLLLGL